MILLLDPALPAIQGILFPTVLASLAPSAFARHLTLLDVLPATKDSFFTNGTVSLWIVLLIWLFIMPSAALESWPNLGLRAEFPSESDLIHSSMIKLVNSHYLTTIIDSSIKKIDFKSFDPQEYPIYCLYDRSYIM